MQCTLNFTQYAMNSDQKLGGECRVLSDVWEGERLLPALNMLPTIQMGREREHCSTQHIQTQAGGDGSSFAFR